MPDRRCRHIFAMLSDYLNAELPVKHCRDLERHLKSCEPCIAYLESPKKHGGGVPPVSSTKDSRSLNEGAGSSVVGSSGEVSVVLRRSGLEAGGGSEQ